MAPAIMGNPDRPELGEELTNSFCRTDPEIAKQFARVTFMSDNRGDLAKVPARTLVLQCKDDIIAGEQVGEYVHRQPAAKRAGHPRCDRPLPQPERAGAGGGGDPRLCLSVPGSVQWRKISKISTRTPPAATSRSGRTAASSNPT